MPVRQLINTCAVRCLGVALQVSRAGPVNPRTREPALLPRSSSPFGCFVRVPLVSLPCLPLLSLSCRISFPFIPVTTATKRNPPVPFSPLLPKRLAPSNKPSLLLCCWPGSQYIIRHLPTRLLAYSPGWARSRKKKEKKKSTSPQLQGPPGSSSGDIDLPPPRPLPAISTSFTPCGLARPITLGGLPSFHHRRLSGPDHQTRYYNNHHSLQRLRLETLASTLPFAIRHTRARFHSPTRCRPLR